MSKATPRQRYRATFVKEADPAWLNCKQAADRVGLDRMVISRAISAGKMPYFVLGTSDHRKRFITAADLHYYLIEFHVEKLCHTCHKDRWHLRSKHHAKKL